MTSKQTANWALALHGGAGTIPRDRPADEIEGYREALANALELGRESLAARGTALDAVEIVVRSLEDDPHFNAGHGAVFTHDAAHELDACIIDGKNKNAGAVAAVRTVANPITLARHVLENSPHALLVAAGAEQFAIEQGFEAVEQAYFHTEHRRRQLETALAHGDYGMEPPESKFGTVGCVALDQFGNVAAATSTGGMTNKRAGRVGDTAIVGAGSYASNESCAISCTGRGEQLLIHTVARSVSAAVELGGLSLADAARRVVQEQLSSGDGGLIAVSPKGELVCEYNSMGMYRALADSAGRREIAVWES